MGKPRGMKSASGDRPEFFKVYLPELSSQRLRIPPAFLKYLGTYVAERAILKDLKGGLWHVQLGKVNKNLFIQNGWQDFVRDQSLKTGEFLVFSYNKNFVFEVRIFGKDGCKKESFQDIEGGICNYEDDMVLDMNPICVKVEEDTVEEVTYSMLTLACNRKLSESTHKRGFPEVARRRTRRNPAKNVEDCNTFEKASFAVSKNPSFKIIFQRANNYVVNIPVSLLKKHGISVSEAIVLRDRRGKVWPVKVKFRNDGRIALTSGWSTCWRDLKVQIGDVCMFEFVLKRGKKSNEVCFQVDKRGRCKRNESS